MTKIAGILIAKKKHFTLKKIAQNQQISVSKKP